MATKSAIAVPAQSANEKRIVANALDAVDQATRVAIKSPDDNDKASSLLSTINQLIKKADGERRALTDPLNQVAKAIKQRFDTSVIIPLEKARDIVREKQRTFMVAEREKREAEARKLEEQRRKAEEQGREQRAANLAAKVDAADDAAKAASKSRGVAGGTSYLQKRWTFRVSDPMKVPREYLTVDETLIRNAIGNGVRQIDGVSIYQEDVLANR